MTKPPHKLVVAVSSRALFDLDESHRVFEQQGQEVYCQYQVEHENEFLQPGFGFNLVKKLLSLNKLFPDEPMVEVVLLSRNSADTGLRIFNSIAHHGLNITRAAFTSGVSPYAYMPAFGAHLFLSANAEDVEKALAAGCAAATIVCGSNASHSEQLRIAFDGDSVLFSDESERIYQQQGLRAFTEHEQQDAEKLLNGGPFKVFLNALHQIQARCAGMPAPIRTALVTARSAPSHVRVVRTLRAWGIRIDEALFLGGLEKGAFLKAFDADIFFDDQRGHCESANHYQVAAAHVPHGVRNQDATRKRMK